MNFEVDILCLLFYIVWRCVYIAKNSNELPINESIRVSELMVIGPNGEQMGIKKREDALTLANYAGLDLVLMSDNGANAVGKIMDYNKYRYEKQKKTKEAQKKQRESNKEVKEDRQDAGQAYSLSDCGGWIKRRRIGVSAWRDSNGSFCGIFCRLCCVLMVSFCRKTRCFKDPDSHCGGDHYCVNGFGGNADSVFGKT